MCGSFWGENWFLFTFVQFYYIEQKRLFTTNSNFPLDLLLFTLVEKKKLSKYFWASFWDSFFWLNREVFSEFLQKCFKTTEKHSLALCGSFWSEKQILFIFVQFYCFEQKGLFTINPNLPLDFLILKLVEKNKLSEYFWGFFWESFFWLKREIFSEFTGKSFITTGKHSLTVCGSFWGEIFFFLIFVHFYWLDQKQLFKQTQIFLRICPISNLLRKINFLSNSLLLSGVFSLWPKKREIFCELARKRFKTTEKHSLAVCG